MLKLILIIFATLISSDVLCQNSDSLKCWSDKDKLKWSDFKGRIPDNADSLNLYAVAPCRLHAIPVRTHDVLSYHTTLVFLKYDAWARDTAKYLLAHEQLHFDIAELHARKLRMAIQEISKKIKNPKAQDFLPVIQKLYLENRNMQDEYDQQTYHGVITDTQQEWQKKIFLELNKLKAYTSTAADCK